MIIIAIIVIRGVVIYAFVVYLYCLFSATTVRQVETLYNIVIMRIVCYKSVGSKSSTRALRTYYCYLYYTF